MSSTPFKITKYGIIGNLTGSVQGTASYALTASFAENVVDLPLEPGSAPYSIQSTTGSVASGTASFAEGSNTVASGRSSHAEGSKTTASGLYGHAEGFKAVASGTGSHAEGNNGIAFGIASHVEGYNGYAGAEATHVEGRASIALGYGSHAEGYYCYTADTGSHAEGYFTLAKGRGAHAENGFWLFEFAGPLVSGSNIITCPLSESGIVALQRWVDAVGLESVENIYIGSPINVVVSGKRVYLGSIVDFQLNSNSGSLESVEITLDGTLPTSAEIGGALIPATVAVGYRTHAEGKGTLTIGENSHAEGSQTVTNNDSEHAQGRINVSHKASNTFGDAGNTIHSVGIGLAVDSPRNAHEIMQNGDHYIYGVGGYDGTNPVHGSNDVATVISSLSSQSHTHTNKEFLDSIESKFLPVTGGTVTGDLTITSNLYVKGTASYVDTEDLVVKDKLILVASGSATQAIADGAGIAIQTASAASVSDAEAAAARIQYRASDNHFTASVGFVAPSFTGSLQGTASNAVSASYATGIENKIDGVGVRTVVELTQQEYDNLETKDVNTFYIITDSTETEITANKVTTLTSSSTDLQYPTAKCVYDALQTISSSEHLVEVTYADLKALVSSSSLVPGTQYRITDYNTTTTQSDTRAAGHQFDVIVVADSVNTLNENARAIRHAGDTYFTSSSLEAWQLKYGIDNDTAKYAWADTGSGKGVIYWMKDEWNNECPYDFKNIQFKVGAKTVPGTVADVFYFTFSQVSGTNDTTVNDYSLNGTKCFSNRMGIYFDSNKQTLPFNVFRNANSSQECYSNVFGDNCSENTFGIYCHSNTFGNYCSSNVIAGYFAYSVFGNKCNNIQVQKQFVYYLVVESGNQYINLTSTQTPDAGHTLRNITIACGTNNSTSTKTVSHNSIGDYFKTTYQAAESRVVSV